eukprot:6726275-Pyramimonas_sp.AAC.1
MLSDRTSRLLAWVRNSDAFLFARSAAQILKGAGPFAGEAAARAFLNIMHVCLSVATTCAGSLEMGVLTLSLCGTTCPLNRRIEQVRAINKDRATVALHGAVSYKELNARSMTISFCESDDSYTNYKGEQAEARELFAEYILRTSRFATHLPISTRSPAVAQLPGAGVYRLRRERKQRGANGSHIGWIGRQMHWMTPSSVLNAKYVK